MQFITDITRNEINKIIDDSLILLSATVKLFSDKNKKINFEILLIDYYNSLMIKKNMGTLDNDDIKFINLVNNNKVEDLMWLTTNLNFVRNAFIATVNFNSLANLDKQQVTLISDKEKFDNDLTRRPLYKINLIASIPSYEVQDILNYYKEYLEINGSGLISHDAARDIIFSYLQEMKQNDFESYKNNLLAAIPVFYKWGRFTMSKHKGEIDIKSKMFIKRIEWLKIKNILELTKYDNHFLIDIITQYLYFKTLPNDITDKVEEFSDKELSKRIKRKIKKMEENKTTSI